MRITVTDADITRLDVDVVVNAANGSLQGGGGVDGAIHRAAGPGLAAWGRRWVEEHGPLATGEVVVCDAFGLPARQLIQTVGPVWAEHQPREADRLLAACYRNALGAAAGAGSIAFPNISTGIFGFPKERAADVVAAVMAEDWDVDEVVFVAFDPENRALYEDRFGDGHA